MRSKCSDCRFHEDRPEVGMGTGLLYCAKKNLVIGGKTECDFYRKTSVVPRSINRRARRFQTEFEELD